MSKKQIKLFHIEKEANIRGQDVRPCPFGLPIPEACENAGGSVARMAPIEDREDEELAKANRLVYAYHKECRKCPYAEKILEDFGKVSCDFGDTGAGKGDTAFRGSPLYPQTFHGIGLDGLYGYPLGFYADNNESRNLFFGLFSLLGRENDIDKIIKIADKCDNNGDKETADKIDSILKDISSSTGDELEQKLDKLYSIIDELRDKYEDNRDDTGLMWELSEKWWNRSR